MMKFDHGKAMDEIRQIKAAVASSPRFVRRGFTDAGGGCMRPTPARVRGVRTFLGDVGVRSKSNQTSADISEPRTTSLADRVSSMPLPP